MTESSSFLKLNAFKDGDYYKLRFYPSEKLEQVVSIPYWMTRKGMNNCPFYAFYKGKKVTSSSASTGSFNFLPSVSSGARTSLELGISGYSFSLKVFFIALNFNPNLKHGKFKALRTSFPLPTYFFCTV